MLENSQKKSTENTTEQEDFRSEIKEDEAAPNSGPTTLSSFIFHDKVLTLS